MSASEDKGKIGAEHASAMGRQGLRELRGALYPESNVAQPPEYGIYGTKTPGEVAEDRREDADASRDIQGNSVLEDRLRQADRGSVDRSDDGKERDMDD